MADLASAMYAVIGVVSALVARERTGEGSVVDIAMLDALVSWRTASMVPELNQLEPAPYPPNDPAYGVFLAGANGELVTLSIAGEDRQWRDFCEVIRMHDLADVPVRERELRSEEIVSRIQDSLLHCELDATREALSSRGVTLGRVNDDRSVAEDPQVVFRELIVPVEEDPNVRVVRQPILFDGVGGRVRTRSPGLGEHSRELLHELGYDEPAIDELIRAGILGQF
jgi:crotonobetainyl-CoA:carnitine CoA-transferase CaiB-like acyl-CoA transferase